MIDQWISANAGIVKRSYLREDTKSMKLEAAKLWNYVCRRCMHSCECADRQKTRQQYSAIPDFGSDFPVFEVGKKPEFCNSFDKKH